MTNLNSVTELTEFTSLNSETKPRVFSLFSKLFKSSEDNLSRKDGRGHELDTSRSSSTNTRAFDRKWDVISGQSMVDCDLPTPSSTASEPPTPTGNPIEVRTLPNVLRRMSNLLASRNTSENSVAYNETHLKKFWMPDSVSKECYDCGEKFTAFRRKHHCRVCGQIFCSQCCNREVPGKIIRCSGNLRVCMYCCKVVLSYLRETDLTVDLKALQDDLESKFGDTTSIEENFAQDVSHFNEDKDLTHEPHKRKISFVYQEENFTSARSSKIIPSSDNTSPETSLMSLLCELMKGDNAISLQDYVLENVQYKSCFTGSDLIDWLISQRKTSSRVHSLAIGQVLLDANCIAHLREPSTDFLDGCYLYKFCNAESCIHDENQESILSLPPPEKTSRISRSGFHLDINITKNTAHISRHPTKATQVKDKKKHSSCLGSDFTDDVIRNFSDRYLRLRELTSMCWETVRECDLDTKDHEKETYSFLKDAFKLHITNIINQLLTLEKLPLSWSEIVSSLADQALREIKVDFNKIDICDIGHYVQVKKLPGGERKDCRLVGGIACTKNVAHREMNTRLTNPRILLLQCAIVYQRMEGRLMSLEPVMMQEQEYLRHVVGRISALEPNLILVHRNVSRLAQASLNALGITLVLNVKMSVMQRIARCTNADIVTSVDAHIGTSQLGICRSFYTDKYILVDGSVKTLMFFDECAFSHLGCTILLRGASATELKKLKRVTRAIVSAKYNARLEKSFLLDEFAKPATFQADVVVSNRNVQKLAVDVSGCDPSENLQNEVASDYDNRRLEIIEIRNSCTDAEPLVQTTVPNDKIVRYRKNSFETALQNSVLSYSLFIQFNAPYLETEAGRRCELRKYFARDVYFSNDWRNDDSKCVENNDTCDVLMSSRIMKTHHKSSLWKKNNHIFTMAKLKDDVTNDNVKGLLASYRATGGRLTPKDEQRSASVPQRTSLTSNEKSTVLETNFTDPRHHQRISVLFCSFSHLSNNSPEFCVNPWTVTMDFYGCNDIPLGSFLEKYCFKSSYMCPSDTCETPMIDHERRFVHDGGCIQVTLNELDALPDKTTYQILFWSVCTVCKTSTPITAMSNDTWNLSFAKYLELRFHANHYTSRANTTESCRHSLHHDYCQFFYHRNIVASFKYSDILRWEISLPPKVLQIYPSKLQTQVVLDQVKKWAIMGHEIFSSILEKLCLLDGDASTIQSLKKHLIKEQTDFKLEVDDIQVLLVNPVLTSGCESDNFQSELYRLEDKIVEMKQTVAKTNSHWDSILVKLSHKKRDDRQKVKSFSNDPIEHPSPPLTHIEEWSIPPMDENVSKMEMKKELSVSSEDNDGANSVTMVADTNRIELENFRNSCSRSTGDGSDVASVDLTCEDVLPQSTSQDKISVKALFSHILPNTFQNHSSSLTNPINSSEHYIMSRGCTVPIVVYESEPSSAIAYALSTNYYHNALDDLKKTGSDQTQRNNHLKENSEGPSVTSSAEFTQINDTEEISNETETSKMRSAKLLDTNHIEVTFQDAMTSFTVKIYFAQQFKEIRSLIYPAGEEAFARSLSRCVPWAALGGKSGSSFCKTKDDRFILKEMTRFEIHPFLEIAPHYFNFIRSCCLSQQPTLLVKIVGVYFVKFRNPTTNLTFQSTLLVMENLFYMRDIIRKFDLKGSVRNRLTNTKNGHEGELVLLDENLINMTCVSPLYIYPHSKAVLMQAMNNDVKFLASQSVMDYSLLVGLDEVSQELVVGIIDYIRTFTWDKKLETMVKKSGILGGQGKLPTIISPDEYKNRFIAAMHKYFIAVPDQWHNFGKESDN